VGLDTSLRFKFAFFSFFLFFFTSAVVVDQSAVNSIFVHYSQISLFNNFFIKNESYDTIQSFKNYFVTVFSVFSFQFQENKFYPNEPNVIHAAEDLDT